MLVVGLARCWLLLATTFSIDSPPQKIRSAAQGTGLTQHGQIIRVILEVPNDLFGTDHGVCAKQHLEEINMNT